MTKLNASITQNYRLTTDATDRSDASQFVLLRRHIVDPTKAPGYKPPANGSAPALREEWREFKYYTLNSDGLKAAVQAAILRDTDVSQAETIAEALRMYAEATARLADVIEAALAIPGADSKR